MSHTLDDVNALFAHLGIDPNAYQRFARNTTPGTRAAKPVPQAEPGPAANKPTVEQSMALLQSASPQANSFRPVVSSSVKNDRWRVLRGTSGQESTSVSEARRDTTPAIALHSVAGGGGVTTILATLARALSLRSEHVLVGDSSEYSTLPLYFGGRRLMEGLNTMILPGAVPLHLRIPDAGEDSGASSRERGNDEWLWNSIDQLSPGLNRVLLEVCGPMSPRSETWLAQSAISLIVLVPDMRSAIGVQRIMKQFQEREQRLGVSIPKYFLLNKFDESSALNVDMRNWFSQQLGDALLPFVLRRDEKVAEALAEGLTVLDYAPDSPATEDFARLVDWLKGAKS